MIYIGTLQNQVENVFRLVKVDDTKGTDYESIQFIRLLVVHVSLR